ncbi:MAG: hypothetical protein Q9213_003159 [Squamulea squamosa]
MPPSVNQQVPAKRSRGGQEPDIAKRLTHGPNIKALKNIENAFYKSEQSVEKIQDSKYQAQDAKSEIKELKLQLSQVTTERNAEKAQRVQLSRVNDDLKAEILKLQPQSQITDSHVAEKYSKLHQNISSWLSREIRYFEEQWKSQNDGNFPKFKVLRWSLLPEHIKFLKAKHSYGPEYLAVSYILLQLHKLLFDMSKGFFAFDQSEAILLGNVEEGLIQLDPPRDPAVVRYLRSEVLKGFVKSEMFQKRQAKWMSEVGLALLKRVAAMLPETGEEDQKRRHDSFRRWVLEPAFDLACDLQTSVTVYGFSEPMTEESQFKCSPLRFRDSEYCTMINIDTRLEEKVNEPANSNHDTIIAQRVLLIAPGLIRFSGDSPKRLTGDVVCVSFLPQATTKMSSLSKKDQDTAEADSGGCALGNPRKKQRKVNEGHNRLNAIDLDVLVKTKKEDASSDGGF